MARLLGGLDIKKPGGSETGFRLNLFTTDEEEEYAQVLVALGFAMQCHVHIPGDSSWPLTALGTEQQVFSILVFWLLARRAISITGLAFPPGDTGGQQQVTICA